MVYTETKEKGEKKYYYRVRSIRKGKKVDKQRVYLGANLKKQEILDKEQQADKILLNIQEPTKQEPVKGKQQTEKQEKDDLPQQLNARKKEFSEWMSQVLQLAKIIDNRYKVKSMFVWMPYGYDMMLRIKALWDQEFKKNNIKETYFPLIVPLSYAEQNESWWTGFKEEGFWAGKKNKTEFILRPTGEPAMYPMFSKWIRAYSDLPLKIYETVFSYRYETKQTRPLIRDREIGPWYEIHTAHATKEEAEQEIQLHKKMNDLIWEKIAIQPLIVNKPKWECFPGAEGALEYYTLMPNGKVLENGSINNLGQAYAKKFNIKFIDKDKKEKYAWQTCTGNGERFLAAVISQHGDDSGLVLPPNIAPIQVKIIPIFSKKDKNEIIKKAIAIKEKLSFRTEVDKEEKSVGSKFYDSELKGIPVRIEIGKREIKEKKLTLFLRNTKKKIQVKEENIEKEIEKNLKKIQKELFEKSKKELKESIVEIKNLKEIAEAAKQGKIAKVYWCESGDCNDKIVKQEEGLDLFGSDIQKATPGKCISCNKKTTNKAYIARSY
jgi:prolyl-tRNA synthetase